MIDESRVSLTSRIRQEALRLGFFKIGITPARPLPDHERFERWLREGMHGEMAYMERQASKRRDPNLILEDARSLIIAAMNYQTGDTLSEEPDLGKISRYAWGDDYHRVVKDRLQELNAFIENEDPATR